MNKQLIQKFLDKACYDEQCQIELDDVVDLEKFAELIVRECIHTIEHHGGMCGATSGQRLRDKFGVEQ